MELWEFANHLCPRVELLTAIPRRTTMPEAEEDKRRWVKKYLGEDVVVNFAHILATNGSMQLLAIF